MISAFELRRILETAFLPTLCTCKVGCGYILCLQLANDITHQVELTVTGIDARTLSSNPAIAKLVAEIKEEAMLRGRWLDKLSSRD